MVKEGDVGLTGSGKDEDIPLAGHVLVRDLAELMYGRPSLNNPLWQWRL